MRQEARDAIEKRARSGTPANRATSTLWLVGSQWSRRTSRCATVSRDEIVAERGCVPCSLPEQLNDNRKETRYEKTFCVNCHSSCVSHRVSCVAGRCAPGRVAAPRGGCGP